MLTEHFLLVKLNRIFQITAITGKESVIRLLNYCKIMRFGIYFDLKYSQTFLVTRITYDESEDSICFLIKDFLKQFTSQLG